MTGLPAPIRKIAHGTVLEVGDDGTPTEVWTTVGAITKDVNATEKVGTTNCYPHDQTTTQKDPTAYDAGNIQLEVLFDSLSYHGTLEGYFRSKRLTHFRVTYTDSGTQKEIYHGIITGWDKKAPEQGYLSVSLTIERTGAITNS